MKRNTGENSGETYGGIPMELLKASLYHWIISGITESKSARIRAGFYGEFPEEISGEIPANISSGIPLENSLGNIWMSS